MFHINLNFSKKGLEYKKGKNSLSMIITNEVGIGKVMNTESVIFGLKTDQKFFIQPQLI